MFEKAKEITKKIWEKICGVGRWIKERAGPIVGSILIATALAQVVPTPIPEYLQLKVTKDKILSSREYDWIDCEDKFDIHSCTNKGKMKSYLYVSEEEVPIVEFQGMEEAIEKRIYNTNFFYKGKTKEGKEEWVAKVYSGGPFYKDEVENKWFFTENATTTIEAFEEQTRTTFWDRLLDRKVYAASGDPIYSGAGDGAVWRTNQSNWSDAQDTAAGTGEGDTADYDYCPASVENSDNIYRCFFPFDTSGIGAGQTITAATLDVYSWFSASGDNDGDDWVNVVQTDQANTASLATGDYDECGDSIDDPTEGATRIDISNMPNGDYVTFTLTDPTGWGWIDMEGWTKLGTREGHDALDNEIVNDQSNYMYIYFSEETGTGKDPYLTVTYEAAAAEARRIFKVD